MGDSCAQGGKPGIKETGTPEDVPRTAAITHAAGIKKAPADVMGALLRLELHGFPHPVAELAATVGGYRAGPSLATSKSLSKPTSEGDGDTTLVKKKIGQSHFIGSRDCRGQSFTMASFYGFYPMSDCIYLVYIALG